MLLYPEATPGLLKFNGSRIGADKLLRAINTCRSKVLPDKKPTEMKQAALLSTQVPQQESKPPLSSPAARRNADAVASTSHGSHLASRSDGKSHRSSGTRSSAKAQASVAVPADAVYGSYWNKQKSRFWVGIVVASAVLYVWDKYGQQILEAVTTYRRLKARKQGKKFDEAANLEDIATLMMLNGDVLGDQQQPQQKSEEQQDDDGK